MRARVLLAAGALFRDPAGRVLLVEPTYKDTWEIPGGVVDDGESPYEGCAREILEELGFERRPGRLLVVDHCLRPHVQWEGIRLVFDGGVLDGRDVARIVLPSDELRAFRFVEPGELAQLASRPLALRITAALSLADGSTVYLEDGVATVVSSS